MRPLASLALLLLPALAAAQDPAGPISAVVRISGLREDTPVRGSGFVVGLDADRATIVTASHVVEGVAQIEVSFAIDPTKAFPVEAGLKMEPGQRGLAVIQVRGALPGALTALGFDTGPLPEPGEDVLLVGFPNRAAEPRTLRRAFVGPDGNALQLDQPVGEGFSGAPVLRRGNVIGVVVDEDPQLTFAVKALVAQDAVLGWKFEIGDRRGDRGAAAAAPCAPGEKRIEHGIAFLRLCPGTFTLGSAANDASAFEEERPAHEVRLSGFWIGETEITNEQYRKFRPEHPGDGDLPATEVTWDCAQDACERFGGRLPTEAEWEYAARAGSRGPWWFGDRETRLAEHAWYEKNSGDAAHPVGQTPPNAWGLRDMHGNVWEWVLDWNGPYPAGPQIDPSGPSAGTARVLRGGSFHNSARTLRSSSRGRARPGSLGNDIGFRCVLPLDAGAASLGSPD